MHDERGVNGELDGFIFFEWNRKRWNRFIAVQIVDNSSGILTRNVRSVDINETQTPRRVLITESIWLSLGTNPAAAISVLSRYTGKTPSDIRKLLEQLPVRVFSSDDEEHIQRIVALLEDAGAQVQIVEDSPSLKNPNRSRTPAELTSRQKDLKERSAFPGLSRFWR